ncbi:endolytic transglycosylase MltG [Candidatus Dojkabacteria bacterium]|uniref:Endolytic murein transglycosylase n=1 Tax=Candidatus Dojkabacteria bacterium TaxID=2099670 RepID=A0A955L2Z8_9BACT|nr:endolytic transglycosylase MltG [Candidatus Dojkabacteria bacterium]
MNKYVSVAIIVILILIVAVPGFLYLNYQQRLQSVDPYSNTKVYFKIEQGMSAKEVAQLLKEKDLISDEATFYIYGRISNKSGDIQAGDFELSKDKSIPEIYDALQKPVDTEITVTIPEGLRGDEIAETLNQAFQSKAGTENKFVKGDFIDLVYNDPAQFKKDYPFLEKALNLEGFLYPDSYKFFVDATAEDVVVKLLDTFNTKVYAVTKDLKNPYFPAHFGYYEVINLASIVEREGINKAERTEIASILLNRLNGKLDGILLLQADATLLYEKKTWILNSGDNLDKTSDSAYNTYKNPGLPPTPICNPGSESILATFAATESPYLYYQHKNGKFLEAKTLSEHYYYLNN